MPPQPLLRTKASCKPCFFSFFKVTASFYLNVREQHDNFPVNRIGQDNVRAIGVSADIKDTPLIEKITGTVLRIFLVNNTSINKSFTSPPAPKPPSWV